MGPFFHLFSDDGGGVNNRRGDTKREKILTVVTVVTLLNGFEIENKIIKCE